MGQSGQPGYDFGTNEILTAERLRRWLQDAHWENLSYSDAPAGMIAAFNQTAAAPESNGNLWFSLQTSLCQIHTSGGWVPLLDPFSWYSRRFRNQNPDAYGPLLMEIYGNGVDITSAAETNMASFTLGNMLVNEAYRFTANWRGDPMCIGTRQDSGPTLATPLICGAGIVMVRRDSSAEQAAPGLAAGSMAGIAGCARGTSTASNRATWANGVWLDATLHSGSSNMGLMWTIDGHINTGYQY